MANKFRFNNSKKGMSEIVTTMIMVALSLAAIVIVWGFVSNFINQSVESSGACFGNYDKIKLNKLYTCYEPLAGGGYNLRFSIGAGDVEVDKIIVAVYSESATKSYTITNSGQNISGLTMYPSGETQIILPGKNSGLTYEATGFSEKIDNIEIAPTINDNQCEVSDSYAEIDNCAVYVG